MASLFDEPNVWAKLQLIKSQVADSLEGKTNTDIPLLVARDAQVVALQNLPDKRGLSYKEGQARLMHDLASIELQAMELSLRSLVEYPEAPVKFREELAALTLSEATHLEFCLNALSDLGYDWGHWPVHLALWQAVSAKDELLDRVLIVHRYLEGSGLDAGELLYRRLCSLSSPSPALKAVELIFKEELGHVQFGSDWYRELCRLDGRNSDEDFIQRFTKLRDVLPRRLERINHNLRSQAGFSKVEIQKLEEYRLSLIKTR